MVKTTCESIAAWTGRLLNKETIKPTSSARDDDETGPSTNVINSMPPCLAVSTDMSRSKSDNGCCASFLLGHQTPAEVNEYWGCLGAENEPSVKTDGTSGDCDSHSSSGRAGRLGKFPAPLMPANARTASKCECGCSHWMNWSSYKNSCSMPKVSWTRLVCAAISSDVSFVHQGECGRSASGGGTA